MEYPPSCPHCGAHLDPGEVCNCLDVTQLSTAQVEAATGISRATIYAALWSGLLIGAKLDGKTWSISAGECMEWAQYLWKRGRTTMYPPDRAEKYLRDFHLFSSHITPEAESKKPDKT